MEPLKPTDPPSVAGYRMLGRLGAGGMGQVFLASSPDGAQVAFKVILPGLADQPEFRRRFRREVEAAKRVHGPYLAEVVAADPDGDPPWLATRYVAGPSLADAVGRYGPLPPATVRAIAVGTAEALTAISRAGLVHRDLKPSNVLLDVTGPRIIDFGIARAADASQLTQTGVAIGTPGFMAPEQLESEPLGSAADVFSLGAVLAFALTGAGPFGEGSPHVLMGKVLFKEPDLSAVPADWRDLIGRCLAKRAADRPTIAAVAAECLPAGRTVASLFGPGWLPAELGSVVQQRTMTMRREVEFERGRAAVPAAVPVTASAPYRPPAPLSYPTPPPQRFTTSTDVRRRQRRTMPIAVTLAVIAAVAIPVILFKAWPTGSRRPGGAQSSQSSAPVQAASSPVTVPKATSRAPVPRDRLPAAYAKTWAGDVYQRDIDKTYPVVVTLGGGKIGSVVGTVRYRTLDCSGQLTLDRVTEAGVEVTERINQGTSNCVDVVPLRFTLQPDGTMRYDGREPAYERDAMSGTLRESPGSLSKNFVGTWRGSLHQHDTGQDYTVVVVIKDRAIGSTGSIDYPPLRCGGTLTLQYIEADTAWFTERITRNRGPGGCIARGSVSIELTAARKSTFQYFDSLVVLDEALVEGALTRA